MRHLPVSKVASLLLVLLLAVLPAAPAKADEVGDSFFAEIAGYFEALFTHWLGDSPQNAPSALGYSYPPHGANGDEPEIGIGYPPHGDALTEEPPVDPEIGHSYPPHG